MSAGPLRSDGPPTTTAPDPATQRVSGRVLARVGAALSDPPGWLLVTLWVLAGIALVVSLVVQYVNPVLPGEPWQSQGQLVDFRDSVWTPGGYLLAGGNPYDTAAYLAAVPWTQGLALYAPAWLLVGIPLSQLPYLVANAVYQVLGIVVVLLLIRVVLRWTLPRHLAVGTPIGVIWLVVWAAGRYALANVSTALVVLGVVLVLRGVWRRTQADGGAATADLATAATAAGVALSLLKPQFGLVMVVVAAAGRRWDALWRGVLAMSIASTPVLVACVVASGGFPGFLDGLRSNLARSTSADSAAGLSSPLNVSIDLLGQVGRLGIEPSGFVRLAVPLLALAFAGWLAARSRTEIVLTAGIASVMLLGFIHQFYDLLVLVLPLCVGIAWIADGVRVGWTDRVRWLASALPTVHVHRVSTNVVPGLTTTGADRVDTTALLVAAVLCIGATVGRRRRSAMPASSAGRRGGSGARERRAVR